MAAEAALKRLPRAAGFALLGTLAAYALLGLGLGLAAGWSRKVAIDQAYGLALHAAVVFARGVLPAVVATWAACLAWRRGRGRDPAWPATAALSLALSGPAALLALTAPIAGWPRLEVAGAPDAVATAALLGAAAAAAELLTRWRQPRRALRL